MEAVIGKRRSVVIFRAAVRRQSNFGGKDGKSTVLRVNYEVVRDVLAVLVVERIADNYVFTASGIRYRSADDNIEGEAFGEYRIGIE